MPNWPGIWFCGFLATFLAQFYYDVHDDRSTKYSALAIYITEVLLATIWFLWISVLIAEVVENVLRKEKS